jgi:transposase InsO family protein
MVEYILTDNGREHCGRQMIHPYQIFLELNDIEHRRTKVANPRTNGFVERFNRAILDDFLQETFRTNLYLSLDELQTDLDAWLASYNNDRPHRGYRSMGRRPIETIEEGKKVKAQMSEQVA